MNVNFSEIYVSQNEISYIFNIDQTLANTLFRMYYNGPKGSPMRIVDFVIEKNVEIILWKKTRKFIPQLIKK